MSPFRCQARRREELAQRDRDRGEAAAARLRDEGLAEAALRELEAEEQVRE